MLPGSSPHHENLIYPEVERLIPDRPCEVGAVLLRADIESGPGPDVASEPSDARALGPYAIRPRPLGSAARYLIGRLEGLGKR